MNRAVCIIDIDIKNFLNLFLLGGSFSYNNTGSLAKMPNPVRNEDKARNIIINSLWW